MRAGGEGGRVGRQAWEEGGRVGTGGVGGGALRASIDIDGGVDSRAGDHLVRVRVRVKVRVRARARVRVRFRVS